MKQREAKRRFWSALIARYEGSGKRRKEFAAEAGVGLAIFQYWLYKLRRERERETAAERKAAGPEVRLVPVTVSSQSTVPARLELRVAGVRLRVPVGADAGYVAQLACALRDGRPC
jgi:hypothetical protein